jgi:hypothetical protein
MSGVLKYQYLIKIISPRSDYFSPTDQSQEQTPEELEESKSLKARRFSLYAISLLLSMILLCTSPIYPDVRPLSVSLEE